MRPKRSNKRIHSRRKRMNLKEIAIEIRDILSERQKELDLTFEEEKHR